MPRVMATHGKPQDTMQVSHPPADWASCSSEAVYVPRRTRFWEGGPGAVERGAQAAGMGPGPPGATSCPTMHVT